VFVLQGDELFACGLQLLLEARDVLVAQARDFFVLGIESISMRIWLAASSIRSMALSGRKRSEM
jgi:hypothetical protein